MLEFKFPDRLETSSYNKKITVFFSGGITGAPDWQNPFAQRLNDLDIILFNPRRESIDMYDLEDMEAQIDWEYNNMKLSDIVIFWFPKEAKCMITLLELGRFLERSDSNFIIGVEEGYERANDVYFQTKHGKKTYFKENIVSSLEDLEKKLREEIQELQSTKIDLNYLDESPRTCQCFCGGKAVLKPALRNIEINNEMIEIEERYYFCPKCNDEFTYFSANWDYLEHAYRRYRLKHDWVMSEEINYFCKVHGLDKASEILKIDKDRLRRLSKGCLQSGEEDIVFQDKIRNNS